MRTMKIRIEGVEIECSDDHLPLVLSLFQGGKSPEVLSSVLPVKPPVAPASIIDKDYVFIKARSLAYPSTIDMGRRLICEKQSLRRFFSVEEWAGIEDVFDQLVKEGKLSANNLRTIWF
jgi:hypothetical protein